MKSPNSADTFIIVCNLIEPKFLHRPILAKIGIITYKSVLKENINKPVDKIQEPFNAHPEER
jgi:hypothetical protein